MFKIMLWSLFYFGLFYVSSVVFVNQYPLEAKPIPVPVEKSQPITDWKKVYDLTKANKSFHIILTVSSNIEGNDVQSFIVDGDRWYYLYNTTLRGCGPICAEYSYSINVKNIPFHEVPSDNARIVVVGSGKPKLKKVEFKFED